MVLCFSRPWCVRPFFANFEKMEFDRSKCHLLIFNNTNNPKLDKMLMQKARRYQQMHKYKYGNRPVRPPFASVRLYKTFRKWGGIVFGQEVSWEKSKLPSIYEMQKDIVGMITTDYFFMFEDDTIAPPHAVKRLFALLKRRKDVGIVSGVEPTRTPFMTEKVRMGVYYLLRPLGRILERISLDPNARGVHEVDAVGFYCLAVKTNVWKQAFEIMQRELEVQKTAEPNWAIDTLWTNDVQRAGYKVLADFETPCLHMQQMPDRVFYWALDKAEKKLDYYIEKYKIYATGVKM